MFCLLSGSTSQVHQQVHHKRKQRSCDFVATHTFNYGSQGNWIDGIVAPCQCPGRKHKQTSIRWIGRDGKLKVRGIPEVLSASAAYPVRMGKRIYECHIGMHKVSNLVRSKCAKVKAPTRVATSKPTAAKANVSACIVTRPWLQPSAGGALQQRSASSSPSSTQRVPGWLQPSASSK